MNHNKDIEINGIFCETCRTMIRVFSREQKGSTSIIAVADHQKDLNNLRLMSYRLLGKDKVQLNKEDFGGPYLKLGCERFVGADGLCDEVAMRKWIEQLQKDFS